jgi:hypothetical protein
MRPFIIDQKQDFFIFLRRLSPKIRMSFSAAVAGFGGTAHGWDDARQSPGDLRDCPKFGRPLPRCTPVAFCDSKLFPVFQ